MDISIIYHISIIDHITIYDGLMINSIGLCEMNQLPIHPMEFWSLAAWLSTSSSTQGWVVSSPTNQGPLCSLNRYELVRS